MEHRGLIARGRLFEGRSSQADKLPAARIPVTGHASALPRGDHQILPSIPVQVRPRHARAQLTEPDGQRGLYGEIIEGIVVMRVAKRGGDIGKPRLTVRRQRREIGRASCRERVY